MLRGLVGRIWAVVLRVARLLPVIEFVLYVGTTVVFLSRSLRDEHQSTDNQTV